MYCWNHVTQSHAAKVQFTAETWAVAKEEKKNKDARGATTRRNMAYIALWAL